MKSSNRKIARTITAALISLFCLAGVSLAATQPLNEPYGLALDSKGNLFVANYGANQVLLYDPNYQQLTSKTITDLLDGPTGVALDPLGNIFVANVNSNTVNQYTPNRQINMQFTNGIATPTAIAVDGIGNLWVTNSSTLTLLGTDWGNVVLATTSASYIGVKYFLGVATGGGKMAVGTDQGFEWDPIALYLTYQSTSADPVANTDGTALAFDGPGNIYSGNADGSVDFFNVTNRKLRHFLTLSYIPRGIVVDNARGRVYISDFTDNQIQVYSTKGVLLKTIK